MKKRKRIYIITYLLFLILWFLMSRVDFSDSISIFYNLFFKSRITNFFSLKCAQYQILKSWNSAQQSCSVAKSDSFRPHRLQFARPPCPSLFHGVCPSPYPLNQWCCPTISSCAALFLQQSVIVSVFCNNLNGERIWKRRDTRESLCCTPEANTTC